MFEELKSKLLTINTRLENLRGYLDIDNKQKTIDELTQKMSSPNFWDNQGVCGQTVKELKSLKAAIEPYTLAFNKFKELQEITSILKPSDESLISDLNRNINALLAQISKLEFQALLGDETDRNSAILSINAGAGGTESCDWVSMLLRMYIRFAEKHNYKAKELDILHGEEAGIKNVTLFIEGEYAYGYLKAERGVHRLVRISPFDANKRRHTSFASVDVIPEVKEDIEIKIEPKDLLIETFRSSGPGGQHMQKTDSAVRITHLPSGLVTQCQNERSQHQNKETAMKILKAKLYELERQKLEEQFLKQHAGEKKKIEWGSQIRSYVMHPYNLVKDHRTDYETGDVNKVLDGGLDEFIEAYLKMRKPEYKINDKRQNSKHKINPKLKI
ncbi:MAG: peptide chain release factor 2 [Candidatus Omnitrophica bacterium]|nr:peptide chain release factor 2 [Candidatus Omnitrophota bacterium]